MAFHEVENAASVEERNGQPRTLLLFDPEAHPQSWNERMADGEFAVLYSGTAPVLTHASHDDTTSRQPFCLVFPNLPSAEAHAREQVGLQRKLRCRIYDRRGLATQPVQEIAGTQFKGESELSPRFRRWGGSLLLFGGLLLTGIDWLADFRYFWPSMIGTRMIPTGLVLLVIELGFWLNKVDWRPGARQ